MNWFETIKRYYDRSLWKKNMVADAVVAGKISTEQFKEITGEKYV